MQQIMPYIEKEELDRLKQIDVLTYLQLVHPSELVKISHNVYCTRTHDSLKISNGKWMWWSRGIGGKNALDYLTIVEGRQFYNAANYLKTIFGIKNYSQFRSGNSSPNKKNEKSNAAFRLPQKADNNFAVIRYLQKRGIAKQVIDYFIDNNYIYQSKPADNIVFVGFNSDREPKYASIRGIGEQRFFIEPAGSNKKYSFRVCADNNELHIFEGAIDLLSYATFLCREGKEFTKLNLLSLGGVTKGMPDLPESVSSFLSDNQKIHSIHLHLDNDEAGIDASKRLTELLSGSYNIVNSPPVMGKDVNDELLKHIQRERNKER